MLAESNKKHIFAPVVEKRFTTNPIIHKNKTKAMKTNNGIQTIYLSRMHNGTHFLYLSLVLARAEADTYIYGRCKNTVDRLKAAVEKEDADLKLSQKSLLTDEIVAADKERDIFYGIYRKIVQSMLKVPRFAQAAKVLSQHLKDYAITSKMQLDLETGMMINFIADLEDKYAAEVESLYLKPFVEGMKAANEQVLTLTDDRMNERISIPVGTLKASRAASDKEYGLLVSAVNMLVEYDENGDCQSFVDYVNGEIRHYKQQAMASPQTGTPAIPVSAERDAAGRMDGEKEKEEEMG